MFKFYACFIARATLKPCFRPFLAQATEHVCLAQAILLLFVHSMNAQSASH
jgi:hypothetical protein